MGKADVHYRPAESPSERCGNCVNGEFQGSSSTGTCKVVAGKIRDDHVSDKFSAGDQAGPGDTSDASSDKKNVPAAFLNQKPRSSI